MRTPLQALALALLPAAAHASGDSLSRWIEARGASAQALHDGDAGAAEREARRALDARPRGEAAALARLALGLALAGAGRDAAAADALRLAVPDLPADLRGPAIRRLAAALERAGHPGAAAAAAAEAPRADALAGLRPPPDDARRDAVAEGRALLAAGLPAAAARALASAADAGDPGARAALGRARLAAGDARGAAILRELWVERAGEPAAEEAGRALAAGAPPPAPGERLARAERLLATARPRPAVDEIDRAEAEAAPTARSRLLRAVAALQLGRMAEAEALAEGVARDLAGAPPDAARRDAEGAAELVRARAAARQGRLLEAAGRYGRVATLRPAVPGLSPQAQADLADDAAYLSAWLLHEAGRHEEGAEALRRFARERPRARRAPEARWFHAWALVRAGREPEARRALAALAAAERGPLRAAALYWGARLSPGRAAPLDRAAVLEDPDGWYGILAAARLGADAPPRPPAPAAPPPSPPAGADAAALDRAAALLASGLRDDGLAALDRAARGPGARGRAAAAAELAAFAGDPRVPFRIARDLLGTTRRTERWAWPQPFAGILEPAARGLALDPALLLAVMRRESAFEPRARSAAAAEGLLQLRPETADRLAAVLGVGPPPDGALGAPGEAIPLGAAYLALLLSRFGDVPAALAAYNAGPAATAGWAAAGAGTPLDAWVENLSWRETRNYVRGVAADWVRYRRLRGEPPPRLDPAAPVTPPGEGVAF